MVVSPAKKAAIIGAQALAVLLTIMIYGVPYYFIIVNSLKTSGEAAVMNMSWPSVMQFAENYTAVLQTSDFAVIRGFVNSLMITAMSVVMLTTFCSMCGFVLQRRRGKAITFINMLVLTGLMIPPAIVPTIWVMQGIGVYKTLYGMAFVETALSFAFSVNLYRGFMVTIPRELDEAAIIDGCTKLRLFFQIIYPILKPVTITIVILTGVNIYNDFVNPLYFLPGAKNVTVQLSLYNFNGMYLSQWNLLFADVMLISIPPLIMFIFFNKKIVAGMTAGALKA